jgi:arylsulfatase A-like enzyme
MFMKRRFFPALLIGCLFGPGVALRGAASPAAVGHPNVLFIAVDDMNDWVGCLGGNPQTKTPNLDRLARSSVLFTNAYCAAPSCNPSRSAILSGIPPYRSGLYDNLQKLREVMPKAELMPHYFSRNGYWSAGSGKILHYIIDPPSWDDYFPAKEGDNPFPRTYDPPNRPISLPRGGDWQYVETDWAALDITDEQYGGDWLVSKWIGEQLQQKRDKPFFLACGIYRPHEPWFVPKKYFEPFPLQSIRPGPGYKANDLDDVPPAGQKIARNRYFDHIQKNHQWMNGIQAYLASIHFSDAMVGRVLDALEKSPNRDNTIVVLWSDHGWHLGEKEHWQKYTPWRICDRVPLMIRVPRNIAPGLPQGTTAGATCTRVVSLLDLFRTLVDLCGLPEKADLGGQSLVPLLRDPSATWNNPAFTHLSNPESYAISTEQWRYIHYRGGDEELYDIKADPYEWTNLAADAKQVAKLKELRALAPKNPVAVHETQPGINSVKADAILKFVPANQEKCPPSLASRNKVAVIIQNQRQGPVKLIWIDEEGDPHDYGKIAGASKRLVWTYTGHAWTLTDEAGNDLGHFVAGEEAGRVVVE